MGREAADIASRCGIRDHADGYGRCHGLVSCPPASSAADCCCRRCGAPCLPVISASSVPSCACPPPAARKPRRAGRRGRASLPRSGVRAPAIRRVRLNPICQTRAPHRITAPPAGARQAARAPARPCTVDFRARPDALSAARLMRAKCP
ncbi:protein of unknown function [Burkholderia multivorans]